MPAEPIRMLTSAPSLSLAGIRRSASLRERRSRQLRTCSARPATPARSASRPECGPRDRAYERRLPIGMFFS